MSARNVRRGFTLVELLVVIAIIAVLVGLLLPAVQAAREAARRNSCVNNMKQLGTALHNHHDVKNRLPLASTADIDNLPAATGTAGDQAGYSWIVQILPFMEEATLYDHLSKTSNIFKLNAFDPANIELGAGTSPAHVSMTKIGSLICPSFGAGTDEVDDAVATEYAAVTPVGATGAEKKVAIGNYVAFAATYFTSPDVLAGSTSGSTAGDGTLVFPRVTGGAKGLNFKDVKDGTSKTICATESKEAAYASWFDGQSAWVVGAPITLGAGGQTLPYHPVSNNGGTATDDNFVGWESGDTASVTAINYGDPLATTPIYYADATDWVGAGERAFGPSSDHRGNLVVCLFADAHVQVISGEEIDRNVYMHLITRSGNEGIPAELQ